MQRLLIAIRKSLAHHWMVMLISIILGVVPFFWFKPGEMDIGGDGGRLYFYDPINQIKHVALAYVSPFGTGAAEASFFYLPFFIILAGVKYIVGSSFLVISLNNVIKIVVGFLAVYAIVRELLGKQTNKFFVEVAAILAGLFYLSTSAMTENYVKALPSHNQVFLNPLMFYLLLRFFLTGSMKYVWSALMMSLLFAPNFSYTAAHPIFAFYPFGLLFISLYSIGIRHVRPPMKKLLLGFSIFLGLHSFHLIPEALDLVTAGTNTNTRVFNAADIKEQIGYFYGVLRIPKVSFHLLAYSVTKALPWASIVTPFIVLFGLLLNKKREKTMLLAAIFFFVTLFFVTGKITMSGIKLYEWFFYIPGFTMFRNFYGQWQFVFYFFYALLFGLAINSILQNVKSKILPHVLLVLLVAYFAISSWPFLNGSLVNPYREEANGVKGAIIMDPKYEETLSFIRSLPVDGKILVLPFTDSYIQVIHGLNADGAYIGHSTIGQLTGKKDFAGYQDMAPFSDIFWQLSKAKDYEAIKRLLGILNIRYIFYNSDTRIYDTTFPGRPYSPNYVRKYMPPDQEGYKEFVDHLSSDKIYERGFYRIYKIGDEAFLPHFYTPDQILVYEDEPTLSIFGKASAFFKGDTAKRALYIENQTCQTVFTEKLCKRKGISVEDSSPKIQFEKVNPTKYRVKIFDASNAYILSFSEAFHKDWKIYISNQKPQEGDVISSYFDGTIQEGKHRNIFFDDKMFETLRMKSLPGKAHFMVNGYANAWFIRPSDVEGRSDYELIIEMTGQRMFYVGLGISIVMFIGSFLWGIRLFIYRRQI